MTGSALKSGDIGSYAPYLGGMTPLPPHYPSPNPTKRLGMGQSFVDYLWNSRSPLGFPYPLTWPKRPLPSFPGLGIGNSDSVVDSRDNQDILKSDSASAFTPVSTSGTISDDSPEKAVNFKQQNQLNVEDVDPIDDKSKEIEKVKILASKSCILSGPLSVERIGVAENYPVPNDGYLSPPDPKSNDSDESADKEQSDEGPENLENKPLRKTEDDTRIEDDDINVTDEFISAEELPSAEHKVWAKKLTNFFIKQFTC